MVKLGFCQIGILPNWDFVKLGTLAILGNVGHFGFSKKILPPKGINFSLYPKMTNIIFLGMLVILDNVGHFGIPQNIASQSN